QELHEADLLLHLVDAADEHLQEHIQVVENILSSLNLQDIPKMLVFNKADLISDAENRLLTKRYQAMSIVAKDPKSTTILINKLTDRLNHRMQHLRTSSIKD
ncbi:MAG: GTPase HflX, partial [Deltaproteobacteria bacterium]|nr:GTPase HflX [Deltaproteobacteria bacterium]